MGQDGILGRALIKLHRHDLTRALANPFFRKGLPERPWVFILGCYNSGTTLLNRLLSAHPRISGLPVEGVALTNVLHSPEEYGWTRMWLECREKVELARTDAGADRQRLLDHWSPWLETSADYFLEKSITNLLRWQWLDEHFPKAFFIGIVRNGYAVSEGTRRRAVPRPPVSSRFPGGYPIELCGRQWVEACRLMKGVKPVKGRYLQITYEELTTSPLDTLARVWEFLGIGAPPVALRGSDLEIGSYRECIEDMNAKSLSSLAADDIIKLNPIISDTMVSLGYDIFKQGGN